MPRPLRLLPSLLLLLSVTVPVIRANVPSADRALREGRVEDAAALLHSWLAEHPSDPQAHLLLCRAFLAERENDQTTAEGEFRQATHGDLRAAWNAAAWIDLGAFCARRHQSVQAITAVRNGIAADPVRGAILVDAATVLIRAGGDPGLAHDLLREYIASPARSVAAPAFNVHLQFGDLLAHSRDLASARQEYATSLALAPNFPPARNLALDHPQPPRPRLP